MAPKLSVNIQGRATAIFGAHEIMAIFKPISEPPLQLTEHKQQTPKTEHQTASRQHRIKGGGSSYQID